MADSSISDASLMDLKDTDKYLRQIGSKALIMVDNREAREYEEKRRSVLEQKNRQQNLEKKIELLEEKFDKILNSLEFISKKISNNAD